MGMTVYDVLIKRFKELKTDSEAFLSSGSAKDFPEYREICGVIRGLATAIREVEVLMRTQDNDDE